MAHLIWSVLVQCMVRSFSYYVLILTDILIWHALWQFHVFWQDIWQFIWHVFDILTWYVSAVFTGRWYYRSRFGAQRCGDTHESWGCAHRTEEGGTWHKINIASLDRWGKGKRSERIRWKKRKRTGRKTRRASRISSPIGKTKGEGSEKGQENAQS